MAKAGNLFYTIVFLLSNIYRMTLKGQLENLTSDQGRVMIQVDPNRNYNELMRIFGLGRISIFSH